jgi:signal transduction histidine kinase
MQPDALRHIVLNLLDNAVKYGPRGQAVRLGSSEVRGVAGSREVRIEITDEGPGVPAADRERIWSPYQRGSDVSGIAGSGVGLSVVRDVVAQHGGRAWVEEGAEGRGTRVVVAFPASNAAPILAVSSLPVEPVAAEGDAPAPSRTRAPAHHP